jgi:putative ABC transport system ATP-binding protein
MSAALQLRLVSRVYGEGINAVHALEEVDLDVDRGELVAIMGPSGSGKSTLLTIAGTLEDATSGDVCIDGTPVGTMRASERARLRRRSIGFVFQDYNLLAGLTAAENVSMPLELDGMRAREARAAALTALAHMGIDDLADRFPDDLSGGERQRVAIARALDTVNGEAVMRLVREACHRGAAGVVVTHEAHLASWADRVVFLRDGRVIDHTSPPQPESLLGAVPRS